MSDLVSFVQSKVKKPHPEAKVKQRSQPLDFSHLFNAIHERRYRDDSENRITMNLSEQPQSDNLLKFMGFF